MDVGFPSNWLVVESKGDVIDSQIISIDVLALFSKGKTYMQFLLFS
jgi:hypothetical protein